MVGYETKPFSTEDKQSIIEIAKQILNQDLDRYIGKLEKEGKITLHITIERKKKQVEVEHDLSRSTKKIKIFK